MAKDAEAVAEISQRISQGQQVTKSAESGSALRYREDPLAERVYDVAESALAPYSYPTKSSPWALSPKTASLLEDAEKGALSSSALHTKAAALGTEPAFQEGISAAEAAPAHSPPEEAVEEEHYDLSSGDPATRAMGYCMDAMELLEGSLVRHGNTLEQGNQRAQSCNQTVTLLGQLQKLNSVNFDKIDKVKGEEDQELVRQVQEMLDKLKEWGLAWQKKGWDTKEERNALASAIGQMIEMGLTKDQKFLMMIKHVLTQRNLYAELASTMQKTQADTIRTINQNMSR